MGKFDDKFITQDEDDPYAELFADCTTPEQVLELQAEIEAAEQS